MLKNLFIGLGGQGGRTLAALRRTMVIRDKDKQAMEDVGAKFDYLYIDSDTDVRNNSSEWKVFGENVSLDQSSLLSIQPRPVDLRPLVNQPNIRPWIGDIDFIQNILGEGNKIEIRGASQRRRFGRFLFAQNISTINQTIADKVQSLIYGSSGQGDSQCAFHIFATLGGGTGSGSIVDMITILRTAYSDARAYPIHLYLYLAEGALNPNPDVGYFHLNQYAALRDINALMVGKYKPLLLSKKGENFQQTSEPVNQVILSSNKAQGQEVKLDTQIKHIAEACFEKIRIHIAGVDPDVMRALTGQDLVDNNSAEPTATERERSYKFASVGMKRWEIPTTRIKELLVHDLQDIAINRWLYQSWNNSEGFVENRIIRDYTSLDKIIDEKIHKDPWFGSLVQLKQDVKNRLDDFKTVYGGKNKKRSENLLKELEQEFQAFIDQEGSGVKDAMRKQMNQIKPTVEQLSNMLIQSFEAARETWGLVDIDRYVTNLLEAFNRKFSGTPPYTPLSIKVEDVNNARMLEWEKITSLSELFGKKRELVDAHCDDIWNNFLTQYDDQKKRLEADLYRGLHAQVVKLQTYIEESIKILQNWQLEIRNNISATENEFLSMDVSAVVFYDFDRDNLDALRKYIKKEQGIIVPRLQIFDQVWKEQVGTYHDLSDKRTNPHTLKNSIEKQAFSVIEGIHQQAHSSTANLDPVLHNSLMDRLQFREQGEPQQLAKDLNNFMGKIISSVALSPTGRPLDAPPDQPTPSKAMVIGIPKQGGDAKFRVTIQERLKKALPPSFNVSRFAFYEHESNQEIRVFYLPYWLPARFANVVQSLGQIYETRQQEVSNGGAKIEVKYFPNIDLDGENGMLPDLVVNHEKQTQRFNTEWFIASRLPFRCSTSGEKILSVDGSGVARLYTFNDGMIIPTKLNIDSAGNTIPFEQVKMNPGEIECAKMRSIVNAAIREMEYPDIEEFLELLKVEAEEIHREKGLNSSQYEQFAWNMDEAKRLITQLRKA